MNEPRRSRGCGDGERCVVIASTIARSAIDLYGPLMDEFERRDWHVHVLTSPSPRLQRLPAGRASHAVRMARQPSPIADLRSLWAVARVLRTVRPAAVVAGTPKASLLCITAAAALRVHRRAYILSGLRLEGASGWQQTLLGALERWTSSCAHVVLAVSPSLRAEYLHRRLALPGKVVVCHNGSSHGVDAHRFAPRQATETERASLGLDSTPVITLLGRLTADKGGATLAQAAARMAKDGVRCQFLLVGEQDEADSQALLDQLRSTAANCIVHPFTEDVVPYLAATDILVLPTRREGFPNVVLEAAAMGIPAVTTRATGAIDSVVDRVTGRLVPVDDATALAAALRELVEDPTARAEMGAAARIRALRCFNPADVTRSLADAILRD